MTDLCLTLLDDLAVLSVRGTDAVPFLQGQLSQDVCLLGARGALLAGLHSPQGRCLAVLRLMHLSADHVLIVLPAELAPTVRALLARYVLRSQVKIEPADVAWHVYGLAGPDAEAAASTRLHMPMGTDGLRLLIVAPRSEAPPQGEVAGRAAWRLDDIASGLPEVLAATSGMWTAQMLNLDLLDAVSFSKGCYTGQEIIARAHYRGQVKRRMQRFHTDSETTLAPGSRVRLRDGRSAQVVTAAPAAGGGCEFLAVAPLHATAEESEPAGGADPLAAPAPDATTLDATPLPLPYAVG